MRALVGSRLHGLDTPISDFDYKTVFIETTSNILALPEHQPSDPKDPADTWELARFLHFALRSNPTILETFKATFTTENENWCEELRSLFPDVWSSKLVFHSYRGYAQSQRKKLLENDEALSNGNVELDTIRKRKSSAAWLRMLYNGYELLQTGDFTARIADTEVGILCRKYKEGESTIPEVIKTCSSWEEKLEDAFNKSTKKEANSKLVNDFLLKIRKVSW